MLFLTGLLSIVVQVVLLRELSAAFYGVDLLYLLALGAWLLWTAVGAVVGRRILKPSSLRVSIVLLAAAVAVPLDVVFIRRLQMILGGVPGAFLPLGQQLLAAVLCLLPPAALLGLLFQYAAKRYLAEKTNPGLVSGTARITSSAGNQSRIDYSRRTLARAYAVESIGGIAGGLLTTLSLHAGLPNVSVALLVACTATAAATIGPRRQRLVVAAGIVTAIGCAIVAISGNRIDLWTDGWVHPNTVEVFDSPYGRVSVTETAGQVSVYENNALTFESEGTEPEDFAHMALLQHASPRRVLLIGGASAGLLANVAQHNPDAIDDVDLDARLVRTLAMRLPALLPSAAAGGSTNNPPAVRIFFDDPRPHIDRLATDYDVIAVAQAEPTSAQGNRFFTREFFEKCAAHLSPSGILALRLTSVENAWTPQMVTRTASIYAALEQVFADVVVLPGTRNMVFASSSRLVRDPAVLAGRLKERGIEARMITPRYIRYLYSNDRYQEIERSIKQRNARPNTDSNAASYQATALVWLSMFLPAAGRVDLSSIGDWLSWGSWKAWAMLALAMFGAVVLRYRSASVLPPSPFSLRWTSKRRGRTPSSWLTVAVAAFGGMAIETVLLLHYQLKHGVVFQDLGILLMSVMGGLAAGAVAVDRAVKNQATSRLTDSRKLFASLGALALATAVSVRTGYASGLLPIALLLFLVGGAVAAVFANAASGGGEEDERRLVSPLYAADVMGGSLGSAAASLVMVPILGLALSVEWTAALLAVAMLSMGRVGQVSQVGRVGQVSQVGTAGSNPPASLARLPDPPDSPDRSNFP